MLRDQVQSDKLVPVCQNLTYGYDKEGVELLRGVLDKNTHKDVQAEACLALAQRISQKAQMARHLKDHPEDAKRYEQALGKEYVEELTKADVAKVESESAGLFKDFGEKYAAQVKPDRLAQLFQRLGQSGEAGGEALLRALLEKDTRHDVQGMACLTLAQSLKARADGMPEAKAKDADKLRKESEEFFDRAGDKFADVKFGRGTVGDTAKRELFELRFLSIGKEAPEVEGEDIDGKKFKLTDYRGKVVLIDFWGDW
jgi:hypothetical protein